MTFDFTKLKPVPKGTICRLGEFPESGHVVDLDTGDTVECFAVLEDEGKVWVYRMGGDGRHIIDYPNYNFAYDVIHGRFRFVPLQSADAGEADECVEVDAASN